MSVYVSVCVLRDLCECMCVCVCVCIVRFMCVFYVWSKCGILRDLCVIICVCCVISVCVCVCVCVQGLIDYRA